MRNVRFSPEVVKELRRLVRNSSLGSELQTALSKIYTTGFDNGQAEATKRIREVLNADKQGTNTRDHVDGKQLQSYSGEQRAGTRTSSTHANSDQGSAEPESIAL